MTEEMEAGDALNAQIAVRVMQTHTLWIRPPGDDRTWAVMIDSSNGALRSYSDIPSYSTSMSAAWQVVEKLVAAHAKVGVTSRIRNWGCSIIVHIGTPDEIHFFEYGQTAPEAICRAALKTVDV